MINDFSNKFVSGCIVEFNQPLEPDSDISRFGFIVLADLEDDSSVTYLNQYERYDFLWKDKKYLDNHVINIYNQYDNFIFTFEQHMYEEFNILDVELAMNIDHLQFANIFKVKDVDTGEIKEFNSDIDGHPCVCGLASNNNLNSNNDLNIKNNNNILDKIYKALGR